MLFQLIFSSFIGNTATRTNNYISLVYKNNFCEIENIFNLIVRKNSFKFIYILNKKKGENKIKVKIIKIQ